MYYIQELKKTLEEMELDIWGQALIKGCSLRDMNPEMQVCFQQIKEIKGLEGIKKYLRKTYGDIDNPIDDEEMEGLISGLFKRTKTLSN